MWEKGKIIEVSEEKLKIIVEREENCGSCNLCKQGREGVKIMEVTRPPGEFKVGQKVKIELSERAMVKGVLLLYFLPLLGLILGIALGEYWGNTLAWLSPRRDLFAFGLGIFFLTLLIIVAGFISRRDRLIRVKNIVVINEIRR